MVLHGAPLDAEPAHAGNPVGINGSALSSALVCL